MTLPSPCPHEQHPADQLGSGRGRRLGRPGKQRPGALWPVRMDRGVLRHRQPHDRIL